MKFIHIADVHLGADPNAGSAYGPLRRREIWTGLEKIVDLCRDEEIDLLLIVGDLFHRQPLLSELKEVNGLFSRLAKTQVVLCAGNHDYLKKDSYYRTFTWEKQVHMILGGGLEAVELPEIGTAVYGFSYESKELTGKPYEGRKAKGLQPIEILMVHGGDERHVPVKKEEIAELGYDYTALGHIHKPQNLIPGKMAYCGALEPVDKNDTGKHGYIYGEISDKNCRIKFVPSAVREYVHTSVRAAKGMSGSELKEKIRKTIEEKGVQNIYKITVTGFRSPDILFDFQAMDTYGNIIEMVDDTKPFYDFEKIKRQNKGNILGGLIERLEGYGEDSLQYRAMCEGVKALMETRKD
ncbi:MAG: DNA repair exonuclease [Dorea sp.]|nr:DNA repair exonuclease [Dorea sp.]